MSTLATTLHPNARQCAYIKVDGIQCGSPAWQENRHCHHHHGLKQRFEEKKVTIPPLDDANSVQVAIMDALNGLLRGTVSRPDVYTLLYGIQVARTNLKAITLVPPSPNVIAEMIATAKVEAREEARAELSKELRAELRAEVQADFEREHSDANTSLAEYLLRSLGEEMDETGQAKVNAILAGHGKPPISEPASTADRFDTTVKSHSASASADSTTGFDPASVTDLLSANSWDKKIG